MPPQLPSSKDSTGLYSQHAAHCQMCCLEKIGQLRDWSRLQEPEHYDISGFPLREWSLVVQVNYWGAAYEYNWSFIEPNSINWAAHTIYSVAQLLKSSRTVSSLNRDLQHGVTRQRQATPGMPSPIMTLGYNMETDSSPKYRDGGGQVPSPVDSDLYQVCGTLNNILEYEQTKD